MNTAAIIIYLVLFLLNIGSITSLSWKLRHSQNIEGMVAICSSMFAFALLVAFTISYHIEVKQKNCPEYEQVIVPRLEKVVERQDTLYKLKK